MAVHQRGGVRIQQHACARDEGALSSPQPLPGYPYHSENTYLMSNDALLIIGGQTSDASRVNTSRSRNLPGRGPSLSTGCDMREDDEDEALVRAQTQSRLELVTRFQLGQQRQCCIDGTHHPISPRPHALPARPLTRAQPCIEGRPGRQHRAFLRERGPPRLRRG
ncbi:hypothetical protein FA95DRAFT_697200 [Auriscalpium vulgare]|uniref:Uncharacterized protein n=1 Tax=Auriscalpium vulgare TaxID=40419 RepID=A0ACB8RBF5_9AGAM|nr:hypothetical protein FA95DRAFT_697200 [Auriscalpium vulgare]